MFYKKICLNAITMMPILEGMKFAGKYSFDFLDRENNENAKKLWKKFLPIIKKTGEEESIPIFVDAEEKKVVYASNVEDFLAWIEGPNWWKKL